MSVCCPDHPDIAWILRTGYEKWRQPTELRCHCCGDEIEGDVYEDEDYEILCEYCLRKNHKKDWY